MAKEIATHKRDRGNWYTAGRCGRKNVWTATRWDIVTCKLCLKLKQGKKKST